METFRSEGQPKILDNLYLFFCGLGFREKENQEMPEFTPLTSMPSEFMHTKINLVRLPEKLCAFAIFSPRLFLDAKEEQKTHNVLNPRIENSLGFLLVTLARVQLRECIKLT